VVWLQQRQESPRLCFEVAQKAFVMHLVTDEHRSEVLKNSVRISSPLRPPSCIQLPELVGRQLILQFFRQLPNQRQSNFDRRASSEK